MEWLILTIFGISVGVFLLLTTKQAKNEDFTSLQTNERFNFLPSVKLLSVIDGSTVVLLNDIKPIRIRLDAIESPKEDEPWGMQSKQALIDVLTQSDEIKMEEHGKDAHGHTVATLFIKSNTAQWINVNERVVILGHARVIHKHYGHIPSHQREKMNKLETWARSKQMGLWRFTDNLAA